MIINEILFQKQKKTFQERLCVYENDRARYFKSSRNVINLQTMHVKLLSDINIINIHITMRVRIFYFYPPPVPICLHNINKRLLILFLLFCFCDVNCDKLLFNGFQGIFGHNVRLSPPPEKKKYKPSLVKFLTTPLFDM